MGNVATLARAWEAGEMRPLAQSERLMTIYQEKKLDVQLHIEPGKGHGWKPSADRERELVLQFVEKRLPRD